VLIDIPVGLGAKITDLEKAKMLAEQFIRIGRRLKMKIEAIITDGSEPIGRGVGPILEARDVLEVLNNRGPVDLKNKGLMMAGKLLEMVGKAKKGEGFALAKRTLESGKALAKMREIIEMQGGDPTVRVEDLLPGEYRYDVEAQKDGRISHIDNRKLSQIARIAGSPMDKGAGVYLWKKKGDRVKKGDKLFTIYAESATKLNYAVKALQYSFPIEMKNVLLMVVDDHE
jgi:AMP phosphorylase